MHTKRIEKCQLHFYVKYNDKTHQGEESKKGILGGSNHIVASLEIRSADHEKAIPVILSVLASTDPHDLSLYLYVYTFGKLAK